MSPKLSVHPAAAAATFAAVAAAAAAIAAWQVFIRKRSKNPFVPVSELPSPKFEQPTQSQINDSLHRSFSIAKVPQDLDAIVIGSGIGGTSVAALMSMAGKRVLVLEQHDVIGGCCHTFTEKGYEFDVGIHYIGDMNRYSQIRNLVDQMTRNRLQWKLMNSECFDRVTIGRDDTERRHYYYGENRQLIVEDLCKRFPKHQQAVKQFFQLCDQMKEGEEFYWGLKFIPITLVRLLLWTGLLKFVSPTMRYARVGFQEFMDELKIDDAELRTVLGYCFGDYGCPLSRAPLIMQIGLLNHFQSNGAYYPVGGAASISLNLVPTIRESGGDALVRVRVKEIVCNTAGHAIGVRVTGPGNIQCTLHCPLIISDAGMGNTAEMLPKRVLEASRIGQVLTTVPAGISAICVFVGLRAKNGTNIADLGLKAQNVWSFTEADVAKSCDQYLSLSAEEAAASDVPLLFTSFPSLKDPNWNQRMGSDRLTCALVTLVPWQWFSQWNGDRVKHRDRHYRDLKDAFAKKMWNQVLDMFPQIQQLEVEVFEVGSPVTNSYYIGSREGEIYGLDHSMSRADPLTASKMRPDMGVPGLLLTGQDVAMCGFAGAIVGGILCATSSLNRFLLFDLDELVRQQKLIADEKK